MNLGPLIYRFCDVYYKKAIAEKFTHLNERGTGLVFCQTVEIKNFAVLA